MDFTPVIIIPFFAGLKIFMHAFRNISGKEFMESLLSMLVLCIENEIRVNNRISDHISAWPYCYLRLCPSAVKQC